MIAVETLERARALSPEQILEQVDAMREMVLQSFGGDLRAYEIIRANDPLRRVSLSVE
jgi:hypothetical protein